MHTDSYHPIFATTLYNTVEGVEVLASIPGNNMAHLSQKGFVSYLKLCSIDPTESDIHLPSPLEQNIRKPYQHQSPWSVQGPANIDKLTRRCWQFKSCSLTLWRHRYTLTSRLTGWLIGRKTCKLDSMTKQSFQPSKKLSSDPRISEALRLCSLNSRKSIFGVVE